MKTPTTRQTQLEFAERLVASILQQVFRLNSSARFRGRNELHSDLLVHDGVAGAQRRNAPRRLQHSHSQRQCQKQTQMKSQNQNDLIVSGKTGEQKEQVKVCRRPQVCRFQLFLRNVQFKISATCARVFERIPCSRDCARPRAVTIPCRPAGRSCLD